jgi:hypothetical protein
MGRQMEFDFAKNFAIQNNIFDVSDGTLAVNFNDGEGKPWSNNSYTLKTDKLKKCVNCQAPAAGVQRLPSGTSVPKGVINVH